MSVKNKEWVAVGSGVQEESDRTIDSVSVSQSLCLSSATTTTTTTTKQNNNNNNNNNDDNSVSPRGPLAANSGLGDDSGGGEYGRRPPSVGSVACLCLYLARAFTVPPAVR